MEASEGMARPEGSARGLHEVWPFVGLCSYYGRHIPRFTELVASLNELATKETDFGWTSQRHGAFESLKTALTQAPILGFPREEGQWYLDTDGVNGGFPWCMSIIKNGNVALSILRKCLVALSILIKCPVACR